MKITPTHPADESGWTLALVAPEAWRLVDVLRWARGRPTRSRVAEDLIRRALAVDSEAVPA
ncbi:MAG: hypothetical protein ACYCSX_10760 [Acidimicrobiales bacterium]